MLGCKTAIPLSRKLRTRSPIERGGGRPLSLPLDSKPMMDGVTRNCSSPQVATLLGMCAGNFGTTRTNSYFLWPAPT